MKTVDTTKLDANQIDRQLWQGGFLPKGQLVADAGFDTVVLMASEFQYTTDDLPGVTLLHGPTEDIPVLTDQHIALAHDIADRVVVALNAGHNVLVTCAGGYNRSGLVSALVLHKYYGWDGKRCVKHVKERRDFALHNKAFCSYLHSLDAKR